MKSVRFVLEPEIFGESPRPHSGMWAATRGASDQTAAQSLEAIAHRMNTSASNQQAKKSERIKLLLSDSFQLMRAKQKIGDLKNWVLSFSKYPSPPSNSAMLTSYTAPAGHAASIEREWEEAVKRAHAIQAAHLRMVGSSCDQQLGASSLTLFQEDLRFARLGREFAAQHYRLEPEVAKEAAPIAPTGPAGSMWSNEPIALFSPREIPASQVVIPGVQRFAPTARPPKAFNVESTDLPEHESGDASPKLQKSSSIDAVDALMEGDGDGMVSFGRWRHHKDAPLSLVKDLIERDLRESGPGALYGPGGLKIVDHPLVLYYNSRLRKAHQSEKSEILPLHPITAASRSASQALLLQAPTPVTFSMDKTGMFKTTGFHTRTDSTSSTVESGSPADSAVDGSGQQKDTRRDSGASEVPTVRRRGVNMNPGQVIRPYTPDSGLNVEGLNNETVLPYRRNLDGFVSEKYRIEHCGGAPGVVERNSPNETTQLSAAYVDTPRPEMPMQAQQHQNAQQRGPQQHRGYAMQRTGHHVNLTQYHLQAARPAQARPQAQRELEKEPPNQRATEATRRQGRQVNFRLPGPNARQITLVSAEEADDAMWSDEESEDEGAKEPQFAKRAVVLPPSISLISKTVHDSASPSRSTARLHEVEVRAGASRSGHSSFDSATANAAARLNTSTGPTPSHITPGTTASSGTRTIKSPAHAETIAHKLADHLRNAPADEDETPHPISF